MPTSQYPYAIDSNVLIDINHGRLMTAFFRLPLQFVTTDFILYELENPCSSCLVSRGLAVAELTPKSIKRLQSLAVKYRQPSSPDLSVLVLAEILDIILLTGDDNLRKAAKKEGREVHGTLYIMDLMVDKFGLIERETAASALDLMRTCGSRLPHRECDRRLRKWKGTR
jgi:rRNA-processing protein FCF1